METDVKQNYGQSKSNLEIEMQDKKKTKQQAYVDETVCESEVVKRHPNLVNTDLDDDLDDDYDNDLDDDENNE